MTLTEALAIVTEAADRAGREIVQDADLYEALDQLAADGIERDTLRFCWESAGDRNDIGRSQAMRAALNRIRLLAGEQGRG